MILSCSIVSSFKRIRVVFVKNPCVKILTEFFFIDVKRTSPEGCHSSFSTRNDGNWSCEAQTPCAPPHLDDDMEDPASLSDECYFVRRTEGGTEDGTKPGVQPIQCHVDWGAFIITARLRVPFPYSLVWYGVVWLVWYSDSLAKKWHCPFMATTLESKLRKLKLGFPSPFPVSIAR